jgi:anaerobic magnesium-protoporphyrin IX monomethyl ester cyclase
MKVLLIYPSIDCPPGMSHGLASISAVLKSRGHETRLIQVNESLWPIPSNGEILERIAAEAPGIVGFSAMTGQYPWTCALAREVRQRFPDLPICIGGVHPTMVPEEVAASRLFDFLCLGEGELAFLRLVESLECGEDGNGCPNIWSVSRTGEVKRNPVGPFPDLAALPPLDWDLFDMERITSAKKGWLSIITSRGCPYRCTYCLNREIVERYLEDGGIASPREYLRNYPIESVIDEIRRLRARLPDVNTIIFDDDLFTLNRRYVAAFCEAYRRSGIAIPFVVNAHVQAFDPAIAAALREAGCRICKFGVESGSARVRKEILGRPMTNQAIEGALAAAHGAGLHTSAFIMIGLPTETREEVIETLRLCARTRMGRFRWALFFPFPGTRAHAIARDLGLIDPTRMEGLGSYFEGTCLRFGKEHDLWLDKVGKVCHWWVNAFSDWPSAPVYRSLVEEIEGLGERDWPARKATIADEDRRLSEEFLRKGIPHYSIRFSPVMAVHSDFVLSESERMRRFAAKAPLSYTLD